MSQSDNALDIKNVVKQYGEHRANDSISLVLPKGVIFGLLGPNGAGKTTLIRMITRITVPDSGSIAFFGEALAEIHQRQMGYLPEERGLYKKMKVVEQLSYLMELKGMKAAQAKKESYEWLERFDLADRAQSKVQELSKGNQQKVQFIATIAHKPRLLILDEPFSGLDPINTQLIEDIIREYSAAGTPIIFSTHRMEQVEQLCQQIALIHKGKVVLEGDTRQVRRSYRSGEIHFETENPIGDLEWPTGVRVVDQGRFHINVMLPSGFTPSQMLAWLNERNHVLRFEEVSPSLREIFIDVVKKKDPHLDLSQEIMA